MTAHPPGRHNPRKLLDRRFRLWEVFDHVFGDQDVEEPVGKGAEVLGRARVETRAGRHLTCLVERPAVDVQAVRFVGRLEAGEQVTQAESDLEQAASHRSIAANEGRIEAVGPPVLAARGEGDLLIGPAREIGVIERAGPWIAHRLLARYRLKVPSPAAGES